MEKLKHLTMLSDEEEDLDKVEIIQPEPVLRNSLVTPKLAITN